MFKDFEEKRPLEIRQLQSKEIFLVFFREVLMTAEFNGRGTEKTAQESVRKVGSSVDQLKLG